MSYGGGGTAATDASLAPPLAASTSSSTSTSAPTPSHAPVMTSSSGGGGPPPPPPSDNPLFSSDEARFMTDSFASAFSFDPFQYGAPGFKVPAVLPPGLIHSLTAPNNSMANSFRSGNGAGPSMPPWEASPSNSARPQQSRSRQQSWAPGQAPPYAMPQHQQQASWDGRQQHPPTDASFTDFVRRSSTSVVPQHQQPQHHSSSAWAWGQPSPSTSAAQQLEPSASQSRLAGGAYGKSREWQMQQLQALRAERERYMESLPNEAASSSSSAQPPGAFASQGPAAGLSSLGLSFPSSHDFPAASPPDGSAAPGHMLDAWAAPDGDSEMADQAHTHAQSQQASGSRAPKPRSKAPAATNNDGTPPKRPVDSTKRPADSDAAPGSSDLTRCDSNSYRPWPKAPSPNEPSGSYPPIKLNLSRVDRKALGSDSRVTEAFFGRDEAEERKLFQPHLVDLKERRREERAKKAEMLEEKRRKALQRRGIDPNDNDGGEADGSKASSPEGPAGKKAPHVLLTEAEKKANHIASEQKRRANIRKGYEMLCAGVPALREALEKEGGGAGGGEDGDTSYDVGGERIDGRAGPRSEAVVLGKSVEHLRQLLEEHRDLCSRRDHARAKLARNKLGVDVVVAPGSEDAGEASATSSTAPTTAKKGKAAGGAGKGKGAAAAKGDKKGAEAAAAECKAAGSKAAGKAASKVSKSSTGSGEDGVKKEQTDDGAEVEVDGMQED